MESATPYRLIRIHPGRALHLTWAMGPPGGSARTSVRRQTGMFVDPLGAPVFLDMEQLYFADGLWVVRRIVAGADSRSNRFRYILGPFRRNKAADNRGAACLHAPGVCFSCPNMRTRSLGWCLPAKTRRVIMSRPALTAGEKALCQKFHETVPSRSIRTADTD